MMDARLWLDSDQHAALLRAADSFSLLKKPKPKPAVARKPKTRALPRPLPSLEECITRARFKALNAPRRHVSIQAEELHVLVDAADEWRHAIKRAGFVREDRP